MSGDRVLRAAGRRGALRQRIPAGLGLSIAVHPCAKTVGDSVSPLIVGGGNAQYCLSA